MAAQAVMHTAAKGQVPVRVPAYIECIRVIETGLVTIGRGIQKPQLGASL